MCTSSRSGAIICLQNKSYISKIYIFLQNASLSNPQGCILICLATNYNVIIKYTPVLVRKLHKTSKNFIEKAGFRHVAPFSCFFAINHQSACTTMDASAIWINATCRSGQMAYYSPVGSSGVGSGSGSGSGSGV